MVDYRLVTSPMHVIVATTMDVDAKRSTKFHYMVGVYNWNGKILSSRILSRTSIVLVPPENANGVDSRVGKKPS